MHIKGTLYLALEGGDIMQADDLTYELLYQIQKAVDLIQHGTCTKIQLSPDIKVYAVKNIVRIDIKMEEI